MLNFNIFLISLLFLVVPQKHYKVAVLQADGKYDLEMNVNIGDGGDLWQPGMKLAPGDGKTFPNSDSYQSGKVQKTGVTVEVLDLQGQSIDLQLTVPSKRDGSNTNSTGKFSAPEKHQQHGQSEAQFHVPDAGEDVRISGKIPQLPWRQEQLLYEAASGASSIRQHAFKFLATGVLPFLLWVGLLL